MGQNEPATADIELSFAILRVASVGDNGDFAKLDAERTDTIDADFHDGINEGVLCFAFFDNGAVVESHTEKSLVGNVLLDCSLRSESAVFGHRVGLNLNDILDGVEEVALTREANLERCPGI